LADDGTFLTSANRFNRFTDESLQGWFSVRGERRILTGLFLFLGLVLLGAWTTMFYSRIYRFTYVDWPFFTITTTTAFASILSSGGFGLACLLNYGKGLAQWCAYPSLFAFQCSER